jgi:hypothetical protein
MKVNEYQGGTLIILSKAFDSREKTLFFFYFLVFFVGGLICGITVKKRQAFNLASISNFRFLEKPEMHKSWDFDEIKRLPNTQP